MALQSTLPMMNPYIVDGYQSGDYYMYPYEGKTMDVSDTDNNVMDVHRGKLDIFNLSRKPQGSNPEIGDFMKKCFTMRDKYADVIEHGTFIPLDKEMDENDQIIAYLRHYNGKTLLVVANKNVNRSVAAKIKVPSLQKNQPLKNLLPSYGKESIIQAENNALNVDLGPARAHVFEIYTPDVEKYFKNIYKQNN
jgi:glycosidase